MSRHTSTRPPPSSSSAVADFLTTQPADTAGVAGPSVPSSQGRGHLSASISESMLRSNLSNPNDVNRPHTSLPVGSSSWHGDPTSSAGYQASHPSMFHDSQRHLLMGNKHGMPGENVRSRAPSTTDTPEAELTSIDRTNNNNNRTKEESSNKSNASSGLGSESPDKNSPGVAVRQDTADWLAQIGTGGPSSYHGRPGDRTPPSSSLMQGNTVPATCTTSTDSRHYYSAKELVYTSAPANPALISSLQYSTHVTPSSVNLTSVPNYSPYLSPYALPYVGYPPSALSQGIESYSAMLASMGNQVQQAQSHLPASPYLTPGLAIPGPYMGIPGLTPTAKSGSLSDSAAAAASSVAYIGGHVIPTASLLPTSHSLSSGILSPSLGGHIPGSVTIKTEDRPSNLQSKELEQHRQEQELKRYMESREVHATAPPREARVSPFERRTSPMGSGSIDQGHVKTGRDSGVPESPRHSSMDLSPSGKVDSRQQQYYREIGMGAPVKLESRSSPSAQTYLSSSRLHDVHTLHREQHPHRSEGAVRTHSKSSVISRTPHVPSPLHMSSTRLTPSRQQQPSPHHSPGLVLSPTPQVRPSPTITMTTSLQPTSSSTPQQHHLSSSSTAAIQQEFPPLTPTRTSETHRYGTSTEVAAAVVSSHNKHHRVASSSSGDHSAVSAAAVDRFGKPPLSNVPSYFTRGSIIQLANGELRRVEDLRTEDFVQSADLTEGLKIDSSTVLRVEEDHRRGVAHIGFLVGEQKAQVTVEAPMEHPFFVFGQGWSAVQPDRSVISYGLVCHPLAVGDVCVSLTVKENGQPPAVGTKDRVVIESYPATRNVAREPEHKRIRTEFNVHQSPHHHDDKTVPSASTQSAYHRQTIESASHSSHIPGDYPPPGHFVSSHHSTFQPGKSTVQGSPIGGAASTGQYSDSSSYPQSKLTERYDIDKNANTVVVRTNVLSPPAGVITSSASGNDNKVSAVVTEQQISRPLKRRWSDPVKVADPSSTQNDLALPSPVHPDMLIKQSENH